MGAKVRNHIGMDVAELFVRSGLVDSKSEARRQIKNGGIRVQDIKINDPFARIASHKNQIFIIEAIGLSND
jgi:tyrosyl-tRNA synthetase